jgi:hypothetical protein
MEHSDFNNIYKKMKLPDFKRPRVYIPTAIGVILSILLAVGFHPSFQKKMLLKYVAPEMDSLSVERIHFTPWSFKVANLNAAYQGGQFNIERGSIKYCLSSLLLLNLNLKEIVFQNVDVDVSKFESRPSEEEIESDLFPGVLALLDHGLGYILQKIEIDAEVTLPENQSLEVKIVGGDIHPKQAGEINLHAQFYTGTENEVIEVDNKLILDQLKRGKFSSIESLLNVGATLEALPQSENVSVKFIVTPAELSDEMIPGCFDGQEDKCLNTEIHSVLIKQNDDDDVNRSTLKLDGEYNGNNGWYSGGYEFSANERLVLPYMADKNIPPSHELLKGDLNLNFSDLTGDISFINKLELTNLKHVAKNEKVPQLLELNNNIHVFLLPENKIRIVKFDTGMTDEGTVKPLSANIPSDLNIPLDDINAFLSQDNTLLKFELPEIPIAWLDFLTPDYEITDGRLSGEFKISTDKESVIHINPLKPLVVSDLTVLQAGETLIDRFEISLLPSVAYANESVELVLEELSVKSRQGTLVNAKANTTMHLSGEKKGSMDASTYADIDVHNLLNYLQGESYSKSAVPKNFALDLKTSLNQQAESEKIVVNQLNANIQKDKKAQLLNLALIQPLILNTAEGANLIGNSIGNIAQLKISDIQLDWFSAFVPDTKLGGMVQSAEFNLSMDSSRNAVIDANKPIAIKGVNVTTKEGPLLENVGVNISPRIVLSDKGTNITYQDLNITGGSDNLVSGSGEVFLSNSDKNAIESSGQMKLDIQAITQQPVVSNALQASIVSPVRFEADYSLASNADSVEIDKLNANLFYSDTQPRITLNADSKVHVRTKIGASQSKLGRAQGKITFAIQNLTPEPFVDILVAKGINFKEVTGKAVLTSDGNSLHLDSLEPFTITEIDISNEEGALLHPFDVYAGADVNLRGEELKVQLEPFSLVFTNQDNVKAIDGKLNAILVDNNGVAWFDNLDTHLVMSLPELMNQPSILPKHKLKTGKLDAKIKLDADGNLNSLFKVDNLTAKKKLPLELLELKVTGQIDSDSSFTITAPFRTVGKTGNTDLLLVAEHKHREDDNNLVNANIDSSEFYLNDLLNFVKAISTTIKESTGKSAEESEVEQVVGNDVNADETAFWNVIPYNVDANYSIEKLYYTEFLIIDDIKGQSIVSPRELMLNNLQARFHDSPITLDSDITHTFGDKPYDLEIHAAVDDFNMKQFYNELLPSATPRAEGLFSINFDATGNTPNMSQLRNDLLFDLHLHSEDGVFRLLDPDSVLVGGATGVLGAVGEGVSYIPTGLFGLGAVSRLVDYIKIINYNLMDVRLVRDETQNVQIKNYVVQNSELLMTATGGIEYQEGVDILQSPLTMDANLDFRGKGAAIMYDLNLLKKERNEYEYWKGPEIKFRGTPANNESNLDEVVSTAGNAAVLGGITRPISGLIGNLKHRWFGDNDDPLPYKEYKVEPK